MKYVVYCDESRHDGSPKNPFMAIGSLWLPRDHKADLNRALRTLLGEVHLNAEVKWSKVSLSRLDAYKRVIDFFFDHGELEFRTIVVEQAKVNVQRFHSGDRELGFYKFYYEMLVKWLEADHEYLILLDFKTNKGADRYTTLRTFLERKLRGQAWITDLTVIDSEESPLAQLSDLLTGAVAASWCGIATDTPKSALADYIAGRLKRRSLCVANFGPYHCKVNIFRIDLAQ